MIEYFTISSTQSTSRSRLLPGMKREPPSGASSSVNFSYATGTDDWLGIVNMRIHRPRIRRLLTVLNDCDPPETMATPRVLPCVGRTEPVLRGIQSIWFLKTAVYRRVSRLGAILEIKTCAFDVPDSHVAQERPRSARRSTG